MASRWAGLLCRARVVCRGFKPTSPQGQVGQGVPAMGMPPPSSACTVWHSCELLHLALRLPAQDCGEWDPPPRPRRAPSRLLPSPSPRAGGHGPEQPSDAQAHPVAGAVMLHLPEAVTAPWGSPACHPGLGWASQGPGQWLSGAGVHGGCSSPSRPRGRGHHRGCRPCRSLPDSPCPLSGARGVGVHPALPLRVAAWKASCLSCSEGVG